MKLKLSLLLVAIAAILTSPSNAFSASQRGIASVYSTKDGSKTASGAKLDNNALTAAHRSLPFGSKVRVTNHRNGKSVIVTIIDRGTSFEVGSST